MAKSERNQSIVDRFSPAKVAYLFSRLALPDVAVSMHGQSKTWTGNAGESADVANG